MTILQGVTLTDLKEAQKISSLSHQNRQTEGGEGLAEGSDLRASLTDDQRVQTGPTESTETTELNPVWSKMDEVGKRLVPGNLCSVAEMFWFVMYLVCVSHTCAAGEHRAQVGTTR